MSKRGLVVFSLVFLGLFLLSINSVSAEAECIVGTATQCGLMGGTAVMKLSGTTNAHGAIPSYSGYSYYLCCKSDSGSTTECDTSTTPAKNLILKLSSNSNAHAQLKTQSGYATNICFSDFSCVTTTASSCDGLDTTDKNYVEVLSLSGLTNAHIGNFNAYPTKICCASNRGATQTCPNGVVEPPEECDDGNYKNYDGCSVSCSIESGYQCINTGEGSCCFDESPIATWVQSGSGTFSGGEINAGDQLITYVGESFCLQPYTTIDIVIYEKKTGADKLITHVEGQASATLDKVIQGAWIISASDLSALGDGDSNIYFKLTNPQNGDVIQSDTVKVTVQEGYCGDGVRNGVEQCDGTDLGGAECPSGYTGTPTCTDSCTLDTSSCTLPPTETCESLNYECGEVNGETCQPGCDPQTEQCYLGKCVSSTTECSISSASWGVTSAVEGDTVQLNVQTSNCIGQTISFDVKEIDGAGNPDDDVTTLPGSKQVTSNAVTQTWTAEYLDDSDGFQSNPPEYQFTATIGSKSKKSSNELKVTEGSFCSVNEIYYCSDYTDLGKDACEADSCHVGGKAIEQLDCGYGIDCECYWNGNSCVDTTVPWETCDNDGVINIGEQCDGTDWGPVTGCSYFGYAGGTLDCKGCVFDLSGCTDPDKQPGACGNGVLNLGEQCDYGPPGVLSLYNCSSLDSFTNEGGLSCNNYCLLDTRNCEGGEAPYESSTQRCAYIDSSDDDCEDGYLTRNLTAVWVGEGTGECESPGVTTIQCPAQIKVSAFGVVQFVIAIILLIIIYIIIKSRINAMQKKQSGSRTKSLASSGKNTKRKKKTSKRKKGSKKRR